MIPWMPKPDPTSCQPPSERPPLNPRARDHAQGRNTDRDHVPRTPRRWDGTAGNPYHLSNSLEYNRPRLNPRYLESLDTRSREMVNNLTESHSYQRDSHNAYAPSAQSSSSSASTHASDERHSKHMLSPVDVRTQARFYSRYLQQKESQESLHMQHQQLIMNSGGRESMLGRDIRRSASHEPTGNTSNNTKDQNYLVTPKPTPLGTGVSYDWQRPSHGSPASVSQPINHYSQMGRPQPNTSSSPRGVPSPRGSLTPKPSPSIHKTHHSPQASRQTDYSPPLDLSIKENHQKRPLTEIYGDDQPLDLSVKQKKKKSNDESDDDVILVGVQNLQNPVPYSPASSQATTNYSPKQIPVAHRSMAPSHPLITAGPYHQSIVTQHTPSVHNGIPNRLTVRTSDYKRPVNEQRAHSARSSARSPYSSYPVQPSNVSSQLPLPQSSPGKPQGIPLVWGLEHQSLRPDNKCISNPAAPTSNSDSSAYIGGISKPILESRTSCSSLDSRAGPPEAYQGLFNQERHIQRIDKYKELGSQEITTNSSMKQFSSPLIPWIPSKVYLEPRQSKPSSPNSRHKSPVAVSSPVVAECTPRDSIEKEKSHSNSLYASGEERNVYLEKAPMPVRFSPHCIPYVMSAARVDLKNADETVVHNKQESSERTASTVVRDIPDVKENNQPEQPANMAVPYIPKYAAAIQGSKLFQHPKAEPNMLGHIQLPDNIIQSTVSEPIPLPPQHASQIASVPIIKEENILPLKTEVGSSDKEHCVIDNDKTQDQANKDSVPAATHSMVALQNSVTKSNLAPPVVSVLTVQPQPQSNPNMVSKTESKFASAVHKMIPVANVHPIVKFTPEMLPKLEVPKVGECSAQENEKEETVSLDSKTVELLKPSEDVPQKIQITPNPLFSSHQDEFVRFLSRSNTDPLPQFPRFSKKQMNLLAKTGLSETGNELYRSPDGELLSPELQGKLAAEFREMERVRRNLALHFTTPKGRHKLLAKHSADPRDGLLSNATESMSDALLSKPATATLGTEQLSDIRDQEHGLPTKTKIRRKRRAKKEVAEQAEASDKVPIKKRRRKKLLSSVAEGAKSDQIEGDSELTLIEPLRVPKPGDIVDITLKADVPKRKRLSGKKLKKTDGEVVSGPKRRPKKKNSEIQTKSIDGVVRKMRRKERGRSKSSRTRTAELRKKSKQTSIYDKNAAYEAELRKEEERRMIRRVKREERFQVSVPLTRVDANDITLAMVDFSDDTNVDDTLDDLDGVTTIDSIPTNDEEMTSTNLVKCPRLKKSKKLSFKNKLGCKKRLLSGKVCYTIGVPVDLEPLHTPRKIRPKRLPMMKVTRRRIKRDARYVTKCAGDSSDKKRLFVCRETGETTLHKAARKGYVEVALQCLDSGALDVNVRDNAGYTPLHESCVSGNLVIAKALIARGADANVKALDGTRPLHDAVDNNHVELVRLLLSHGADPTIANYGGRTPLKLARSTNMKAFVTDHVADLRDEGSDWELPAFVGKQGHELGFDLLDGAPSVDDDDVDCDVFADFSAVEQPPVMYLNMDKKTGPRNYHVVNDVCRHLGISNKEDFILLNGDLHFSDYTKEAIMSQLNSNIVCTVDTTQLEKMENPIQLVEIDNVLCQLLEVSREHLRTVRSRQKTVNSTDTDISKRRPTAEKEDAGPSCVHDATDKNKCDSLGGCTSDLRKSKSCTSLDCCGLGVCGLQMSGLNRSDSSPDVKQPTVGYKKGCPDQVKNSTKLDKADGDKTKCCDSIVTETESSSINIILPKEVSQAVLSNDVSRTVTALAREVTKKALTREVNRMAMDRMRKISVNIAIKKVVEVHEIATVTDIPKEQTSENLKTVPIVKGHKKVLQNCETSTKESESTTDGDKDQVDTFDNTATNHDIIVSENETMGSKQDDKASKNHIAACKQDTTASKQDITTFKQGTTTCNQFSERIDNSVYDSDTEVDSADDEIVSFLKHKSQHEDGTSLETHCNRDTLNVKVSSVDLPQSHNKVPVVTSELRMPGTSKSQRGSSSAQENSAPVNTELTLPVLESPFGGNKRVPDVTNEECNLEEEREMPELTPCTY